MMKTRRKRKTTMTKTTTAEAALLIVQTCDGVRDLLLSKNAAYGNSALDPVRIFSKASPVEQLLVRLDDKLSRLARGSSAGEDVELDLLGYLVLLRVARQLEGSCKNNVKQRSSCEVPARSGTRTRATARGSAALNRKRRARAGAGNTVTPSASVSRRRRRS